MQGWELLEKTHDWQLPLQQLKQMSWEWAPKDLKIAQVRYEAASTGETDWYLCIVFIEMYSMVRPGNWYMSSWKDYRSADENL